MREAQQYAAQDAQLKAEAVARDRCEQLIYQAGKAAKGMSKEQKAAVAEGVKEAKRAVKSKDAAQMASAAGRLEQLLQQAGVTIDPDAQYSGSYQNPNDQTPDDDVMDADFEEMD